MESNSDSDAEIDAAEIDAAEIDAAEFETLNIDHDEQVVHVEIDRADDLNTITPTVLDELAAATAAVDGNDEARCLLLSGAGDRAFSAGAELSVLADGEMDTTAGVELARKGQRTFGALDACDTPVVAGIDGVCLGGGMELAAAADLRVATEGSTFGQPEHDLGLLPGWGGTQRLPELVGESRATEIIFTGDHYTAGEMAAYGFLAEVVTGDDETVGKTIATSLADGPPLAQQYTKRAIRVGRDDTDTGLEVEAQAFGELLATEDFSEGVAAFSNDRELEFTGE
jgi:enoyl-CoA hydratase/3-hydroxyacyl-CoA dehydrogenase